MAPTAPGSPRTCSGGTEFGTGLLILSYPALMSVPAEAGASVGVITTACGLFPAIVLVGFLLMASPASRVARLACASNVAELPLLDLICWTWVLVSTS